MFVKDTQACCYQQASRKKTKGGYADGSPLNDEEQLIAEDARKNAIHYLEDLIKFYFEGFTDQVIEQDIGAELGRQVQENLVLGGRGDIFNITSKKCEKIIATLKVIQFRRVQEENVYAYVYPDDAAHNVHLSNAFFNAPILLAEDSQPGTLIHETSHFNDCLGLDDSTPDDLFNGRIDWSRITKDIADQLQDEGKDMTLTEFLKKHGLQNRLQDNVKDVRGEDYGAYDHIDELIDQLQSEIKMPTKKFSKMQWVAFFANANNLEYEVEVRFAHQGKYYDGYGWTCCSYKEKISICRCEGNVIGTKHFGIYHCGPQGQKQVNTAYPYCYHTKGKCTQKVRWTCCNLSDFETGTCPADRRSLTYKALLMRMFNNPRKTMFNIKKQRLSNIREKINTFMKSIATTTLSDDSHRTLSPSDTACIGIIGGGIAGLYSALVIKELKEKQGFQNLTFKILEKSDRIGGRIKTHRYDDNLFDWQYSDMGAMRLPVSHAPVYDMIDFINEKIKTRNEEQKTSFPEIKLLNYFYQSIDAKFANNEDPQVHDDWKREIHYVKDGSLGFAFQNSDIDDPINHATQKFTSAQVEYLVHLKDVKTRVEGALDKFEDIVLEKLIESTGALFNEESKSDSQVQETAKELYKKYGHYTVFSYLTSDKCVKDTKIHKISFDDVILYENVFANSNELQNNLVDWILDDISVQKNTEQKDFIWGRGPLKQKEGLPHRRFNCVKGGMQTITDSIRWLLGQDSILVNCNVRKIKKLSSSKVQVTYCLMTSGLTKEMTFDRVIVTMPSTACANIDWEGVTNKNVTKAFESFRLLNYFPLFKLSLHFSHRFWEDISLMKEGYAVVGGQASTELSSRWFVYPSYGFENGPNQPGALLVYNWAGDAARWSGMDVSDQIYRALDDLNILYNSIAKEQFDKDGKKIDFDVRQYYVGSHSSQVWSATSSTGTAFFGPNQFDYLKNLSQGLDGVIYFAGEYLSAHHAWIVGSIESAGHTMRKIVGSKHFNSFLIPEEFQEKALGFENIRV